MKRRAVGSGDTARSAAIMEAVAERDDEARRIARDQLREPGKRRRRVVGRQQHAAPSEARSLLEVEIGDDERALIRPVQHGGRIKNERDSGDRDLHCGIVAKRGVAARRLRRGLRSLPPCGLPDARK